MPAKHWQRVRTPLRGPEGEKPPEKRTRDLPAGLFLVELLSLALRDTADDVGLDGTEREHGGRAGLGGQVADRDRERRCRRDVAVESELWRGTTTVSYTISARSSRSSCQRRIYLAVVQVTLEDDEVRLGEVEEQIRS